MAQLFGLDIANIVNDAITSAGGLRPGTLTRSTIEPQDDQDLTRVAVSSETSYPFQGYVRQRMGRDPVTLTPQQQNIVFILGGSLAVEPCINDKVVIDGVTYKLSSLLNSDPAKASYEFIGT